MQAMLIKNNMLYLTKGDSGALTVRRRERGGASVPFGAGDVLTLTMKHFPGCAQNLLQKEVSVFEADGSAIISFAPGDTKPLDPGRYWYDLQLLDRDGGVTTLAGPAGFRLGGEVTDEA